MAAFKRIIFFIPLAIGCSRIPTLPEGTSNRIVLLELFGYARCSNCPVAEHQADSLSIIYPDSIAVLVYHLSTLDDTLSPQPFTDERALWYDIHEAPTALFDGVTKIIGAPGEDEYLNIFNSKRRRAGPVEIELEASLTGESGEIHLSTSVVDSLPEDTLRIFTIVFEDNVRFVQSGVHDSIYNHVVRSTVPDAGGLIYQQELDTILTFVNRWNPESMGIVAFVQNMKTREVLNSRVINRIAYSSSFDFLCSEDTVQIIPLNDVFAYHFRVLNIGGVGCNYGLDVAVVGEPPGGGWGASFCFNGSCHPLPFRGAKYLAPGEEDTSFVIETFAGNEPGEICVGFTITDALTSKTIRVHTQAPSKKYSRQ